MHREKLLSMRKSYITSNSTIAKNIPYLISFTPTFRVELKLKLENHHPDAQNFDIGQNSHKQETIKPPLPLFWELTPIPV